jgi:hypothetical protein
LGLNFIVLPKTENLLREAGRFWELLIGYICAVFSAASAALLVWLVYLVAWRNPQEYGVHDLFKVSTLLLFAGLFVVAAGLSVLATRLIMGKRKQLMSPMLLKIWGTFFAVGSAGVLIDSIVNKRWAEFLYSWEILVTSISMSIAAFTFARRLEKQIQTNESDKGES